MEPFTLNLEPIYTEPTSIDAAGMDQMFHEIRVQGYLIEKQRHR